MNCTEFVYDSNGNPVPWSAAVGLMDYELREQLHFELAPCDEQTFYDAYVIKHMGKFNEKFIVN